MTRREVDGVELTPEMGRLLEVLLQGLPRMNGAALAEAADLDSGLVHPLLARLENKREWVASEWEENVPEGRSRRRFYRLTPLGRNRALTLLSRFDDLP